MKIKYICLLFLFFIQFTFAQIGFQDNILNSENVYPGYTNGFVHSNDIDGDGDMDLVVILGNGNEVAWLENLDGQGDFGTPETISLTSSGFRTAYALDVDGDGDTDVISSSDEYITWYENTDGLGTFISQQSIPFDAFSISYADLDNDMDLDIVASNYQDSKLVWFENTNGLGIFGSEQIINDGFTILTLHITDVDNDNDMDIIAGRDNENLYLYENTDALGDFGSSQLIGSTQYNADSISSMDFDNDGDLDLITVDGSVSGTLIWYENQNGLGDFADGINFGTGGVFMDVSDINNDGFMDIIVSGGYNHSSIYHINNGTGGFSSFVNFLNTYSEGTTNIYATDLDGDGDLDVVKYSEQYETISWHAYLDGQPDYGSEKVILTNADTPQEVIAFDIDGDGDEDILSRSLNNLAWFENTDGNGLFGNIRFISSDYCGSMFPTDVDNDGDKDLLCSSGSRFFWIENTGSQNFSIQHEIDDNTVVRFIDVNDIDGDNDLDIIAYKTNQILLYENLDSQGSYSAPQVLIDNVNVIGNGLKIADIDGDTDMDIVFGEYNLISWSENTDGNGAFGIPQGIASGVEDLHSIYVIDIDGDNDLDMVFGSDDRKIAWYENLDGLGAFGSQIIIASDTNTSAVVSSIFPGDVDGDGDIDILSTYSVSNYSGEVRWHENIDGQGTFNSEQLVSTSIGRPVSLFSSDIDNDGDMDVVSAGKNFDNITWYKNLNLLGNEIYGSVRFDINDDGCNTSNMELPNVMIQSSNGTDDFATFTKENGSYQIAVNEGDFVTAISGLPNYFSSNPVSNSSSFSGLGNTDISNFCLSSNQTINDLEIAIYSPFNDPRPGFDITYRIVYKNLGTTQLSGDITYMFNASKMQFLGANETVVAQTANSLTFNYADLNLLETRTIDLQFNVFGPPTTNINNTLVTTATINPVSGDNMPDDNVFTLNQTVIGSYDPNDIRVLEGEEIVMEDVDKYLHYIIRFQNTGTASAINVHVENILDDKLDWTTMQLESLSHAGRVEIKNGSEVNFVFNNINLADSTNDEPNSHGFIAYKIKPKSDVVVGDVFYNTAGIFFDFNPAIITNTVTTEIIENLSVSEFNNNTFSVYPNPTENQLTITSKIPLSAITIFDINGRKIKDVKLSNHTLQYQLDVANLSNGMYFIELVSENSHETQKFIKK
ncbi:T9SS type A sorting domain-containing protein [Lacinutrix sp. WUR7]|uniref:T9SS type A sorting domain-containing protein n=1 Tax=Lacinutrix sp. WUR7 TaxID=2653681 RepID=UPI00193E0C92|nr:T9SS type A sorting domain-containing protein [Lacinutrix sp. WUR7]QRM90716.1 T9SS type A sorting domain-containing protein [Lacinutrix sp. WUR7]